MMWCEMYEKCLVVSHSNETKSFEVRIALANNWLRSLEPTKISCVLFNPCMYLIIDKKEIFRFVIFVSTLISVILIVDFSCVMFLRIAHRDHQFTIISYLV